LIAKLAATPKNLNPDEPVNGEQENSDEHEHARGGRKHLPGAAPLWFGADYASLKSEIFVPQWDASTAYSFEMRNA